MPIQCCKNHLDNFKYIIIFQENTALTKDCKETHRANPVESTLPKKSLNYPITKV